MSFDSCLCHAALAVRPVACKGQLLDRIHAVKCQQEVAGGEESDATSAVVIQNLAPLTRPRTMFSSLQSRLGPSFQDISRCRGGGPGFGLPLVSSSECVIVIVIVRQVMFGATGGAQETASQLAELGLSSDAANQMVLGFETTPKLLGKLHCERKVATGPKDDEQTEDVTGRPACKQKQGRRECPMSSRGCSAPMTQPPCGTPSA